MSKSVILLFCHEVHKATKLLCEPQCNDEVWRNFSASKCFELHRMKVVDIALDFLEKGLIFGPYLI